MVYVLIGLIIIISCIAVTEAVFLDKKNRELKEKDFLLSVQMDRTADVIRKNEDLEKDLDTCNRLLEDAKRSRAPIEVELDNFKKVIDAYGKKMIDCIPYVVNTRIDNIGRPMRRI